MDMILNTTVMDIASHYVMLTEVKPNSFERGDVISMLNFTRDVTITYLSFVNACGDDHILVNYYRELVTCLNIEDYSKAEEYKELIIKYETKI